MKKTNKKHPSLSAPAVLDLVSGRVEAHFNVPQSSIDRYTAHTHPHFELLYIIKGTRDLMMNDVHYSAKSGDLMIFRPGDAHIEYAGSRAVSYFVFRFRPDELSSADISFPEVDDIGPVIQIPHKKDFYELFNRMLMEFKNSDDDESRILLGAYLIEFVIKLRRSINDIVRKKSSEDVDNLELRISRAMDVMHKNIHNDINLKSIASSVFMSVSHFSHVFKNKTGQSPKRFLIKERIKKAEDLLLNTSKTAIEIAEELGYDSPYFFYRQFQKETGMTANQYRKKQVSSRKVHKE